MKKYISEISLILLLTYAYFVTGCSYYKVTHAQSIDPVARHIQDNSRYFIVHQGSNAWHFTNIVMDNQKEELKGVLETLPKDHQYYLTTKPVGPNRIKESSGGGTNQALARKSPTYEVHFYISEYREDTTGQITIPIASITKVEIYDEDVSANTASAVFGAIGVAAGIVVIVGVIVALTKSSCPFVYVYNGTSYSFAGEMYGGAIYASLVRDDYMPLPDISPAQGQYRLKISNKLLERQYTDIAELMVIQHPDDVKVLLDKNGNIQAIGNPLSPSKALSDKGIDYTSSIQSKDSSAYLFNEENTTSRDMSALMLTMERPEGATSGKLVIKAKNSYWLDYAYGKFNEQFGTWFNAFYESQKNVPAEKINLWTLEQGIPLSVYLKTKDGWEFVDYFQVIGPLAPRELVMNVDLSNVIGDEVQIRLECGFMFWEVDYAAMDFSGNIPVSVLYVEASSAIDETGQEVASLLAEADNDYLVQPEVGNEVVITYPAETPEHNCHQTVFLHSRGYYEYIRDYKNVPDFLTLSSFRKKAAFAKFSKKQYNAFISKPSLFEETITSNDRN